MLFWAIVGAAAAVLAVFVTLWIRSRRKSDLKEEIAVRKGDAESDAADLLVRWLEGRRVLWMRLIDEVPEEANESIMNIRRKIDENMGLIKRPPARVALETIRGACLDVLNRPRLSPFDQDSMEYLDEFRMKVIPSIQTVIATYRLSPFKSGDYRGGLAGPSIQYDPTSGLSGEEQFRRAYPNYDREADA